MASDPGSVLRPVVARNPDALSGQPLAESEAVIEAVRRVLWMRHFTGAPAASVAAMFHTPSDARHAAAEIAAACASAADPLLAAERILCSSRGARSSGQAPA